MSNKEAPARTPAASVKRRLAAILSADVRGYSRLMGEDEVATLRTLTAYRAVTDPLVQHHQGRVVGSAGDSFLAEFASVVDAVQCAVEIQRTLRAKNAELPEHRRMEFRIGINLGEVMVEGEQIYGDGVNIAARLEALAEGGGICISKVVYDQVKNKLALEYEDLGKQTVKNIAEPVRVYRVLIEPEAAATEGAGSLKSAVQSSRFKVQGPRLKGKGPKPRRVGSAHRNWAVVGVASLLLLAGTLIAIWSLFFPTPSTQPLTPSTQPALALPDKPSIAVLPFVNLSGDPEQEYFSDGMTEDLITDLSKLSGLFVIARNSVFTYKGKAVKVGEVGRELGVGYVLEGSIRRADSRVRITAQLVNATTAHHLWAERYDRPWQGLFALQDEIGQKIVTALKVKLTQEEQERFRQAPTDNLEAYDYYLRGLEYSERLAKETNVQARQMFEKAIALDLQYAAAYARLGQTHLQEWAYQWGPDPQSLEQAFVLAQRAVALDNSLPLAHLILGYVYLWKKQYEQAVTEGFRARTLDPNDPNIAVGLAEILTAAGSPGEALGWVQTAMRLNPRYPDWYLFPLGQAYRAMLQYEEGIAAFKRLLARNPDSLSAHLNLALSYILLGQEEEARAEATEVLRINPNFSLEGMRQRNPVIDQEGFEWVLDVLRKAGLK